MKNTITLTLKAIFVVALVILLIIAAKAIIALIAYLSDFSFTATFFHMGSTAGAVVLVFVVALMAGLEDS